MRKFLLCSSVLCLFLLVPSSIIQAQKANSTKGLNTLEFKVNEGIIKVYLPDDIRSGDVISGRVYSKPEGKNSNQTERNQDKLGNYLLSIQGASFLLKEPGTVIKFIVPTDASALGNVELFYGDEKKPIQLQSIPTKDIEQGNPAADKCAMPTHVLAGTPMNIQGSFDGDLVNTNCTVGNETGLLLAESPRNSVLSFPSDANNNQQVNVTENGNTICNSNVNAVQMNVSAGKLSLRKGESTYIEVNISGLQDLNQAATLNIINLTTETVKLQPSNLIVVPLEPEAVSSGNFNQRFNIQSLRSGSFSCSVNLDFGDIMLNPAPDDEPPNKQLEDLPYGEGRKMVTKQGPKCKCIVSASVHLMKKVNAVYYYMAMPSADCQGYNCAYKSDKKFTWSISSGNENAEIIKTDPSGFEIEVRQKKAGGFTIKHSATITCGDGTSCSDEILHYENGEDKKALPEKDEKDIPNPFIKDYDPKNPITYDSLPPKGRACYPTLTHDGLPAMVGGLVQTFIGSNNKKNMRRDDFIILEAAGVDFDLAKLKCNQVFDCPEKGCIKETPIQGKVNFGWKIPKKVAGKSNGGGSFVQIGCIPDDDTATNEHVIFKPPYIPLPTNLKTKDTTVYCIVMLSIIDAGSPVSDGILGKVITIAITRSRADADLYNVEITGGEYTPDKEAPKGLEPSCECKPSGPTWLAGDDLRTPEIILPAIGSDKDKLVEGQWVLLTTPNQTDKDLATYGCDTECPTTTLKKQYEDNVLWEWTVKGGGNILLNNISQNIIYEAPYEIPSYLDYLEITITVKVFNAGGRVERVDKAKAFKKEKVFRVYRPGVKLNYTPMRWLPEENNSVQIKSELVYQSEKEWLPGFSHMCRIQYFELVQVSNETGICSNYPVPAKADDCYDLQFKEEEGLEVFAPAKVKVTTKCNLTDQFMQARTEKPVKEFIISVHSLDYGSYGFLRSFANINKGMSGDDDKGRDTGPVFYESIPWRKDQIKHPIKKSERFMKKEYADNRVTLPHDVDENHIADSGWVTSAGVYMADPLYVFKGEGNKEMDGDDFLYFRFDMENIPLGDGFRGDGLTSYEEYRGFKTSTNKIVKHVRTNNDVKTIFIHNPDTLPLELYRNITNLEVLEISAPQYQSNAIRVVNFNTKEYIKLVDQRGLYLYKGGKSSKYLGYAFSIEGPNARPNDMKKIAVYEKSILKDVNDNNKRIDVINKNRRRLRVYSPQGVKLKHMDYKKKLAAITAHELLHGNNVCHHGEGDVSLKRSHDAEHGLRSGDIDCVMHYDNSGIRRDIDYTPEPIGSTLCTSPDGTKYNSPANKKRSAKQNNLYMYFGPAAKWRGNCSQQIRISGYGTSPKTCGNRKK